jgi:hypothetical protein
MGNRFLYFTLAGVAILILALPEHHAFALTPSDLSNGIVNGGSIWLETTLIVALSHISVVAFSLQIGRNYFIRALGKFSLKLGADIWWLAYVLIRDALIIISLIIGFLVFLPATFLDYPMAVPFMPVAILCFGASLLVKLYFDADDNQKAYRIVTLLVFAGTALWVSGTIFVTESPLILSVLPPGVSATSGFWYWVSVTFSSQSNLPLAMSSFEVCLPGLALLGATGLAKSLLHWEARPTRKISTDSIYSSSLRVSPPARVTAESEDPKMSLPFYDRHGNNLNAKIDRLPVNEKSDRPNYIG